MLRALSVGAVLTLVPWIAAAQTEFSGSGSLHPDGTVEIENTAGSVTVTGWDGDRVEVTGVYGRGVDGVDVTSTGARVEIEVRLLQGYRSGGSAALEVRVPAASRLVVETVSADLRVTGFDGRLEAESVSGRVDVAGHPRLVDAETVSGNITVESAERVSAESVNGTIRLRGGWDVEAATVSGSVYLEGLVEVRSVELESVSGHLELDAGLSRGADVRLSTHNGSIDVILPGSVSARFEVSSFSGRIDNEFGPRARRERFSPGQELEFTTGSGDARVSIETFAGSIDIRKKPDA